MLLRVAVAILLVLAVAPAAHASEIIARNASDVRLSVSKSGQAAVSFRDSGGRKDVLVWGAVNAIAPTTARAQLGFKVDYSGGWGVYRRNVATTMKDACRPYDGPDLAWFVAGCKAPDGSYWALQKWQRMLPNYGLAANARQSVWELRISHWTGALPELTIYLDWSYRKFHHLYGSFTYGGSGVYGFKTTSRGVPLDTFGRNIYVDTFNSAYGAGWKRENSFLTHRARGTFCYGFYRHGSRPEGTGERYRATVIGPGVTPDVMWESSAPGEYDRIADLDDLARQRAFLDGDNVCPPL